MAELAITTQAPGQEGSAGLTGLGTEHGIYCVPARDSERTDTAAFLRGINRDDVIEIKSVTDNPWLPGRGLTDYPASSFPYGLSVDAMSGVRVYNLDAPRTLTSDILISHCRGETNLIREILRIVLTETANTLIAETFSRQQQYDIGPGFLRTAERENTLRRFPEPPESWDSMRGEVISPSVSSVAEQLIEGMPCSEEVSEFANGLHGRTPTEETIRTANEIFRAATQLSAEYDFYIDEMEGSLGFMARLESGLLLLAELSLDGTLSGGTYVDNEEEAREVNFLSNATVEEMVSLF